MEVEVSATDSRHYFCVGINTYRHCLDYRMSNLEQAQNLADAGQYEASIARSLIVIAAALKILVSDKQPQLGHRDWCDDPTCP